jgi:hypothetical protein
VVDTLVNGLKAVLGTKLWSARLDLEGDLYRRRGWLCEAEDNPPGWSICWRAIEIEWRSSSLVAVAAHDQGQRRLRRRGWPSCGRGRGARLRRGAARGWPWLLGADRYGERYGTGSGWKVIADAPGADDS